MNAEVTRGQTRLITVAYVIVQFGAVLALLGTGWGSLSGLLSHPARAGMVVAMALGSLTILATGVSVKSDPRELRSELIALIPLALIGAFYFWLIPLLERNEWFVFYPGGEARYTGLLVFGIGTGIRTWGFLAAKGPLNINGLTPEIDGVQLTVSGIYHRIRHPQYLGLWLQAMGFTLVFRSWLGFVVSIGLLWPLINRMDAEEKYLEGVHGEPFRAWTARSWRMFPGVY